jgi:hypothetical protein
LNATTTTVECCSFEIPGFAEDDFVYFSQGKSTTWGESGWHFGGIPFSNPRMLWLVGLQLFKDSFPNIYERPTFGNYPS